MNQKLLRYMKKITSNEATLKRIASYFFIICILLVVLLFKLNEINNNLEIIAENGNSSIEIQTENEEYNSVLNIFTEEPDDYGNYMPIFNETTEKNIEETSSSKPENTTNNSVESTAVINIEETTTVSDSTSKSTFVINVNSNKIHYYDCSFVSRMKEENKKVIQLSKNELNDYLNNGYTLCSTCGG